MPRRPDAPYISINSVRKLTGFDRDTCVFLLEERHIPSFKIGREYRTTVKAVEAFKELLMSPTFKGIRKDNEWLFASNVKPTYIPQNTNPAIFHIEQKINERKAQLKKQA